MMIKYEYNLNQSDIFYYCSSFYIFYVGSTLRNLPIKLEIWIVGVIFLLMVNVQHKILI